MPTYEYLFRSEGDSFSVTLHPIDTAEEGMEIALPSIKRISQSEFANCYAFRRIEIDGVSPWEYLTLDGIIFDPEEGEEP